MAETREESGPWSVEQRRDWRDFRRLPVVEDRLWPVDDEGLRFIGAHASRSRFATLGEQRSAVISTVRIGRE